MAQEAGESARIHRPVRALSETDALRVPPHSVEAEQAVLGGLLLDNTSWDSVADRLSAEDFYRRDHQHIFDAIAELSGRSEPSDAVTLAEYLTAKGLSEETGDGFPEKVTAFRDGMAVHGRYREPCPDCGAPVQRIVRAENETNYCAQCQNDGVVLADRALSRLLKGDWPRSLEELERRRGPEAG